MMLNTIKTIEGYMAEGFTAEEAVLMQEHDTLFNAHQIAGDWDTLEDTDRFWELVKMLDL